MDFSKVRSGGALVSYGVAPTASVSSVRLRLVLFLVLSFLLWLFVVEKQVVRRFVHPPHGASWMDIEVKDCREVANAPDGTRYGTAWHGPPYT